MENSKLFTNHIMNTLFYKLKGIIEWLSELHSFHAVVGFSLICILKIRSEIWEINHPARSVVQCFTTSLTPQEITIIESWYE